jgi:hypothetical protein
MPLLF